MKLQAAIAAVNGDAFEEVVESGAPHLRQRIARALERQAIGEVLVDKGEAAERVRRDGRQQGAAVRQMQQFLLRPNDRGKQPQLVALVRPEISGFGETAGFPETFKHLLEGRL